MLMYVAPSPDGIKADGDGTWDAMMPTPTMEVVVESLEPAAGSPRPAVGSVTRWRLTDRLETEFHGATQQQLVFRQHDG
jgi:hypothetical protein